MASYIYPMEKILEWRKDIENEHSNKFAVKKSQVDIKKSAVDTLLDEYKTAKSSNITAGSPHEFTQFQLYKEQLQNMIDIERDDLDRLQGELDLIKDDLIQAKRDKMAMEKLKEKDLQKHREKENKKEQDFLDEIATLRHSRKEND